MFSDVLFRPCELMLSCNKPLLLSKKFTEGVRDLWRHCKSNRVWSLRKIWFFSDDLQGGIYSRQ